MSDPRHLNDAQIHQIYRRSYWDAQKCWQYLPPLNHVCFDTSVNFGRFYFNEKLPNDPREAAKKALERRMAYRHQRVKQQPDQRVFLEGWLNRDRALLNWVKTYDATR
ncbi:hypothetical protein H6F93_01770 [Leptolyngbya sp. FACHB-671]|nr:glycosyl hydrolase 108 family protein [Leptolyngbya sp. FACHB-671]MBD2066267.1 hypothetical protein [Leptolyngbya sp. FACHB-671]